LVSLILCVNFSTKFRLIEISFSGGLFIIVGILNLKRRETTLKHHTLCVVPQVAHCANAQRVAQWVAPSHATRFSAIKKKATKQLLFRIKLFSFYGFDLTFWDTLTENRARTSMQYLVFFWLKNKIKIKFQ
jgi:hypothetical protein